MRFLVIWLGKNKGGFATYFSEQAAREAAAALQSPDLAVVIRKRAPAEKLYEQDGLSRLGELPTDLARNG